MNKIFKSDNAPKSLHPNKGVFWILQDNKTDNDPVILFEFSESTSHDSVWEKFKKIYPGLKCYDYEHFPRGRVWEKDNKSIIFISKKINTYEIINKINTIFSLENNFIIETYQ